MKKGETQFRADVPKKLKEEFDRFQGEVHDEKKNHVRLAIFDYMMRFEYTRKEEIRLAMKAWTDAGCPPILDWGPEFLRGEAQVEKKNPSEGDAKPPAKSQSTGRKGSR